MNTDIVIGIDGGGTYTRAIAADTEGRILAFAQTGAASPNKTSHAQENVQAVIVEVVARAERRLSDVRALVAGIAGIDTLQDQEWAKQFTDLPELLCPRVHVNDAVVAHDMTQAVSKILSRSVERDYLITKPHLSCAAGAVLMALQLGGFTVDASVEERLRTAHPSLLPLRQ